MLRRCRAQRQAGQDLVEYSLMIVAVALLSAAGFHAITSAQQGYLGGLNVDPPPPTAPGALLHPTSIDTPTCIPGSPLYANQTTQCSTTVRDVYSTVADRMPPWGTVEWLLDGTTSLGVCVMAHPASGSTNTCTLSYTPPNSAAGRHQLSARYGVTSAPGAPALQSNHMPSTSLTLNLTVNIIQFTPSCVNDEIGGTAAEIGHPVRCTSIVKQGNPVDGFALVPDGTALTWTATNGGGTTGVGMFTCAITSFNSLTHTGLPDVFNDHTACPQPQIFPVGNPSFTCLTKAGQCSVLYRRLYDSSYGGVGATPPLVLSALFGSYTFAQPNILSPASHGPHPSQGTIFCTVTGQPGVNILNGGAIVRNATFPWSQSIDVNYGGTSVDLTCTASVFDTDPSPVYDYGVSPGNNSNPNYADAYPPMGPVTFTQNGTPMGLSCALMRVDLLAPLPGLVQALGQSPFLSNCTKGITVAGAVGSTVKLGFTYGGEPIASPGHVSFNCVSVPSACVSVHFNP